MDIVIENNKINHGFKKLLELLKKNVDEIDLKFHQNKNNTGLETYFSDVDAITQGLQKGNLNILASRSSMDKTVLALNIAKNMAVNDNKSIAVFSMGEPASLISLKMISSFGIDYARLQTGQLSDEDFAFITTAISELQKTRIFVDDTSSLSWEIIEDKIKQLKQDENIELIIIDSIQLIKGTYHHLDRKKQFADIIRNLQLMAKEFNLPIILLSQLNHKTAKHKDKRPTIEDLNKLGEIEQYLDLIIFIHRDINSPNRAEIIVAKQKSELRGIAHLKFESHFCRFVNYHHEELELYTEYQ